MIGEYYNRIWKESAVLSREAILTLPGGNEKNHEMPEVLNQRPFEYEEGMLPTGRRRSGLLHK